MEQGSVWAQVNRNLPLGASDLPNACLVLVGLTVGFAEVLKYRVDSQQVEL